MRLISAPRKWLARFGAALVILATCASGRAQTLYVASGGYPPIVDSVLYTVDPATATTGTGLNVTVSGNGISLSGMAFHPETNVLYGVTDIGTSNSYCLVTINPTTGAATVVGSLGTGAAISDISFSPSGVLYGWVRSSSALARIDLNSGVATVLSTTFAGSTDPDAGGLGFSFGGALYLAPNTISDYLWIVDYSTNPTAPTVTQGPQLHDNLYTYPFNYFNSLAYSVANSALFGVGVYDNQFDPTQFYLVSINPATGLWRLIGGLPSYTNAIAFSSTFTTWQNSKFTSAELLNSSVSGITAVYGQDGLPNLVKYALGLAPKTNVTTGLPSMSVSGSDWVFTYTRPSRLTDVTYSVEVSTNLSSWTTTGVTHEYVSTANYVDTWRGRYSVASATNAFFRLNAKLASTATVTVSDATYDGSPHGATASASGVELSQSLTITYNGISGTTYGPTTTAPTNAGTYSASASYAGDTNHGSSSSSQNFTINKKLVTVTADNKAKTYDGAVFSPFTVTYTGLVAPDTSSVVSGSVSYLGTAVGAFNAGSYTITPDVTGLSATNYTFTSANGTLTINPAATTTTVTTGDFSYDTNPHGQSGAVTGANLSQSLTVTYTGILGTSYSASTTAPTNAGNYSAAASYAGDANHTASSDSKNYAINQASSTTTVTVSNAAFDGTPHGGTASVSGIGLSQSLAITYTGISLTYGPSTTPPTAAGDYSASATFAGDTNHTGSTDSKTFSITP